LGSLSLTHPTIEGDRTNRGQSSKPEPRFLQHGADSIVENSSFIRSGMSKMTGLFRLERKLKIIFS